MQPPHIGDILHQLRVFARSVPHNVRDAEHRVDERHGLPGISQHNIQVQWQSQDGSKYSYSIHRISRTRCQFFSNPCIRSYFGD